MIVNEYNPNPRPRVTLGEWHLTAKTAEPDTHMEFVTLYRPHRAKDKREQQAVLRPIRGGYLLNAVSSAGKLAALLPEDDSATLASEDMTVQGAIKVRLEQSGQSARIIEVRENGLR